MLKSINKKTKLLHVKKRWYMIELTWLFSTPPQIKFDSKRNWVELKISNSTLLYYLRMLKSINKKPKLSEELHKDGFGFFGENSYLFFFFFFFFHFYFSTNKVQLLFKFYIFKNILHNAKYLNYWCIFWFGVLNWLRMLFPHLWQYQNG